MNVGNFNNILVAFDGSLDSVQALTLADNMADYNNAKLTVAYVHEQSKNNKDQTHSTRDVLSHTYVGPGPIPTRPVPASKNNVQKKQYEQQSEHVLSNAKSLIANNDEVTYETLIGKPAHELKIYAKDNNVDLIVIGNRGLSGIKKLVMGSVSKKVTDQAECPVLVVK